MKKTEKMEQYRKQLESVAAQLKTIPTDDLAQVTGGAASNTSPEAIHAQCW